MRSSVIVISSVNASFKATSRNGKEPELHFTRGGGAVKPPLRIVTPQSYEEFLRLTRHKLTNREDITDQIPVPRSDTTSGDPVSTVSQDGTCPRCAANADSSAAEVAPQEGAFTRCFSILKHIGANLIMPPYTIDEGLNNIISRKQRHISLNSSETQIPLV